MLESLMHTDYLNLTMQRGKVRFVVLFNDMLLVLKTRSRAHSMGKLGTVFSTPTPQLDWFAEQTYTTRTVSTPMSVVACGASFLGCVFTPISCRGCFWIVINQLIIPTLTNFYGLCYCTLIFHIAISVALADSTETKQEEL